MYKVKKKKTKVKGFGYQTGSRKSLRVDRRKKALRPGKRTTAWGTEYTETRRNRSDLKGKRI